MSHWETRVPASGTCVYQSLAGTHGIKWAFLGMGEGTAGSKAAATHPLQLGVVGSHLLPGTQAGTRSASRLFLSNTEFKPCFCN